MKESPEDVRSRIALNQIRKKDLAESYRKANGKANRGEKLSEKEKKTLKNFFVEMSRINKAIKWDTGNLKKAGGQK